MAMIFGETDNYKLLTKTAFVHVDDLARAHIHLFECPNAKGRYICSKIEVTIEELYKLLSTKYPKYNISNIEFLLDAEKMEFPSVSSKKLLGTGFEFKSKTNEVRKKVACAEEAAVDMVDIERRRQSFNF
ncbi:unnamed protein product [Lactuca virosa]|uniref:Dihydroflavonol-4-reductase n=1 Tax=Lactuca virosa TaxID=75947 RepID=A0AAU9PDN9_9ASTR|nr:unnamed protein product [Lactuca virosa]